MKMCIFLSTLTLHNVEIYDKVDVLDCFTKITIWGWVDDYILKWVGKLEIGTLRVVNFAVSTINPSFLSHSYSLNYFLSNDLFFQANFYKFFKNERPSTRNVEGVN